MSFDVKYIAKLANLALSEKEEKKLGTQLNETLKYIENLNEIETQSVEASSQVTGLKNITREDTPSPSLSQEDALKNTKSKKDGFFKVKGIFENE